MSQETIQQTYNVISPARLQVSNIRGSVDIQPGDEASISITAVKHTNSGNADLTEIELSQEEDGKVTAKAIYKNGSSWMGLNKPCKVDFLVRTPRTCSVKMSGVSCNASVQGLDGDFSLSNVSGAVNLQKLAGPINLKNVSGKVVAEELNGALEMDTVSGKVRIMNSNIPSASGTTVSGSVVLETPLTVGPYRFKTVSGRVSLITPEDTGCNVHLRSLSGKANVSLPITKQTGSRSRRQLQIQDGGPDVHLKSVSGNLRIVTAENQKTNAEFESQPVEEAAPGESQMDILEQINRGDLSVEDALNKLKS
jgi:DUF4097 and DUF4098 domain-containing protein YvlB